MPETRQILSAVSPAFEEGESFEGCVALAKTERPQRAELKVEATKRRRREATLQRGPERRVRGPQAREPSVAVAVSETQVGHVEDRGLNHRAVTRDQREDQRHRDHGHHAAAGG